MCAEVVLVDLDVDLRFQKVATGMGSMASVPVHGGRCRPVPTLYQLPTIESHLFSGHEVVVIALMMRRY